MCVCVCVCVITADRRGAGARTSCDVEVLSRCMPSKTSNSDKQLNQAILPRRHSFLESKLKQQNPTDSLQDHFVDRPRTASLIASSGCIGHPPTPKEDPTTRNMSATIGDRDGSTGQLTSQRDGGIRFSAAKTGRR